MRSDLDKKDDKKLFMNEHNKKKINVKNEKSIKI